MEVLGNKPPTPSANTTQLTGNHLYQESIKCFSVLKDFDWLIDSGASDHMCYDLARFDHYKSIDGFGHMVTIPDGRKIIVKHIGIVKLHDNLLLQNVLYVPDFRYNLIPVKKLTTDMKCIITFDLNKCFIQETLKRKCWLLGRAKAGLYVLEEKPADLPDNKDISTATTSTSTHSLINKAKLWHLRMGHLPFHRLHLLSSDLSQKILQSNFFLYNLPSSKTNKISVF